MKKISSVLIAFIFLFVFSIPTQLLAADGLVFSVGATGTFVKGTTVTVPITVANNSGFTSVGLVLTYDPDILEIRSVNASQTAMPLNSQFQLTTNAGTQWIHLVNSNPVDWGGNGTVANGTFYVKAIPLGGNTNINLGFTSSPSGAPTNSTGIVMSEADTASKTVDVVNDNSSWRNSGGNSNGSSSAIINRNSDEIGGGDSDEMSGGDSDEISSGDSNEISVESSDASTLETSGNDPSISNQNSDSGLETLSTQYLSDTYIGDRGDFIGMSYTTDETGLVPETIASTETESNNGVINVGSTTTFGIVPQTGAIDFVRLVTALGVSIATLIGLCFYIFGSKISNQSRS